MRNKQLKYEDRIEILEKEMKATKHTEKQLDLRIKTEIKAVNKAVKALDASLQNLIHKKCKPIEDKVMIILGTVDDLENEIEHIKDTISNIEVACAGEGEGDEDRKRPVKRFKTELKSSEPRQSRVNVLSQILEGEIENLKTEYNSKFEEFDQRLKKHAGMYQRSAFQDFVEAKEDNKLFEDVNHNKRQEDVKAQLDTRSYNRRLVQSDMVLFQLYSRYKEILKELNIYRDKVMENLRFEEKQTYPLIEDYVPRKRSKSIEFKVFKVKEDVLGKVRFDFLQKPEPEKELNNWNTNFNGRLEDIEKQ